MWIQSRDPDTLKHSWLWKECILATSSSSRGKRLKPATGNTSAYGQEAWAIEGKPNIGYWTLVYVDETDEVAVQKAAPQINHAFGQVFGVGDGGFADAKRLIANYELRGEWGAAEIARNMTNVKWLLERNLVFVGLAGNGYPSD